MASYNVGGRPRKFADPIEFEEMVDRYFDECKREKKPPVVAGLCYFLGFEDRNALQEYRRYEGFSGTVKRAMIRIEAFKNEMLFSRDYATAGVIFDLKNNHGWCDRLEHGEMSPSEFGQKVAEFQKAMERTTVPSEELDEDANVTR